MPNELRHIEPFYGWLNIYSHERDPHSPFHEVEHNQFYYDRSINNIPAHPLWDQFGSESLLIKILYAEYEQGYAIIELFGEWNDLFENDFKLLCENCLTYLIDAGIQHFILICENVFHGYFESDDYYEALAEELDGGWVCALRLRDHVKEEMDNYGITPYIFWSEPLDELSWRKLKPQQLCSMVDQRINMLLNP
ncbi:hypothetical protein [Pontibacter sp. G13]|uniref:hypothetical protein n=1 Tax=Pontibacter sp. G13 TaxID=3074898 RepID=UPI00288B5C14|nr:hypothetical protein [Pontibacter sp. G13]WNJ16321.1 hypothetical protein RJD25_15765 [Pontibacter sp. G13]